MQTSAVLQQSPVQNEKWQPFLAWERDARAVDFKPIYSDMVDEDIPAGLLFSQIMYWHLPSSNNKATKLRVCKRGHYWLVKKHTDWKAECGLSEKKARRALQVLRDYGLITTELMKFGGVPTTHIRINIPRFIELWEKYAPDYDEPLRPRLVEELYADEISADDTQVEEPDVEELLHVEEEIPTAALEDITAAPQGNSITETYPQNTKDNNTQAPEQGEIPSKPHDRDDVAVDDKTFEEDKEKQEIVQLLKSQGVRGATLDRIANDYSYDHVVSKVILCQSRKKAGVLIPNAPGWIVRAIEQDWTVGQLGYQTEDNQPASPNMASQEGSASAVLDAAARMRQELGQVGADRYSRDEVREMVDAALGDTSEPQQEEQTQPEIPAPSPTDRPLPWKAFEPDQPTKTTKRKYSREQLRKMREMQEQGIPVDRIREVVGKPEVSV